MLEDENSLLADAAARILAHAGRLMRAKAAADPKSVESAERKLLKLSKDGSPKAAKASVRCVLSLLVTSSSIFHRSFMRLTRCFCIPAVPGCQEAASSIFMSA